MVRERGGYAMKGRKIVIVDRVRDRVGEKILIVDRGSCCAS
jgi:hypothetical protein